MLPSLTTQKQAFLYYLQNMDLDMLDVILSDEITYYGATKSMFLEKLGQLFEKQRLSRYKKGLKIKQHKKQPTVYYFILHESDHANKFILEDQQGIITKIVAYNQDRSYEAYEVRSIFELFFGDDELANFIPTTTYVMNVYECNQAYEELVNEKCILLTSKDLFDWLCKHAGFYNDIKDYYLMANYEKFRNLYFCLEYIFEQLQHYEEAKEALNTFSDADKETFSQWLADYHFLNFCNASSFESNFDEIDFENNTLKYISKRNIYFTGDDFLTLVKFDRLYNEMYHEYKYRYPNK